MLIPCILFLANGIFLWIVSILIPFVLVLLGILTRISGSMVCFNLISTTMVATSGVLRS